MDKTDQQESLREMVWKLKSANFNTIFFQARSRGDAYYRSKYEPWAENLTGTIGQDPGWDPLSFLLIECRKAGVELHAWFNVYKVRGPNSVGQSDPPHPTLKYPQWVVPSQGELWFDPGIPEARTYLLSVALDLVRNYDIDGIHFDFIRYPARAFPDSETYQRHGNGLDRDNWRRANIDRFVDEFHDAVKSLKPMLKIGAAPLGIYEGPANGNGLRADAMNNASTSIRRPLTGSFHEYFQDARAWLANKKLDYVAPQIYWSLNSSADGPDFAYLVREWMKISSSRHVYAGVGAYKPEVFAEIPAEIDTARANRMAGQSYFRYRNIERLDMFGGRYATPANIPPMPWKDAIPPQPPKHLAVSEVAPGIFHLEWTAPPPAADGDRARYYNIYRSASDSLDTQDPRSIVAITTRDVNSYLDTVKGGFKYSYAVSAFDKGHNESQTSNVTTVVLKEMAELSGKLTNFTSMSTTVGNDSDTPTLVAYKIADRTHVALEVFEQAPGGAERLVAILHKGMQDGGTYVVGLGIRLKQGPYVLRLTTGESSLDQILQVRE